MRTLPRCKGQLPADFDEELRKLGSRWALHPDRPRIEPVVAIAWDNLIRAWSDNTELPLLARKSEKGVARGEVIVHESGRKIVLCDNSPASWSYMNAYSGIVFSLEQIAGALDNDKIPIAMVVDREMRARSRYLCNRGNSPSPNHWGWKVCHKRGIGLHGRGAMRERPLAEIKNHFIEFLSPSNMFLVPLEWGGLGEMPQFIEAINVCTGGL